MPSKSLVARAVEWAWERDEGGQPSTRQTVRYTLTLYTLMLVAIVLAGGGLLVTGHRTAASMLLVFGIWFTAFMGAINVCWEWLKYRSRVRAESNPAAPTGPSRELASDITIQPDTKIGFIVTIVGIATLFVSFEIALFLVSNL